MKFLIALLLTSLISACATVQAVRAPPMERPGPGSLAGDVAAEGVITLPSGLQYFVVRSGSRTGPHPSGRDIVSLDYEGRLVSGQLFDSSYERRTPSKGLIDDFIPGFAEALRLMRPGDEWIIWLPPALGYGERASGPIPANSFLQYRLTLHSVTPAELKTVP